MRSRVETRAFDARSQPVLIFKPVCLIVLRQRHRALLNQLLQQINGLGAVRLLRVDDLLSRKERSDLDSWSFLS